MRTSWSVLAVLGVACAVLAFSGAVSAADGPAGGPAGGKVFELRIYKANPGKLEAVHARFRDHTCKLFQKHGIEVIGFWTPMEGEQAKDTLCYIVAFPSVEAQKKAWDEFKADPEWIKVKADSEKDGVLVQQHDSKNLRATDYSPIR